ncbi:hypothetical protein C0J52_12448 [Blattella germanica]|nr:hypothetical protein C0J52_12448 [Blattella germanica]
MMTPPYPGVMYQTSQGMVYAAAPSSALPNGVIFSLSQGQLQLQHAAAADSGKSSLSLSLSLLYMLMLLLSAILCMFTPILTFASSQVEMYMNTRFL